MGGQGNAGKGIAGVDDERGGLGDQRIINGAMPGDHEDRVESPMFSAVSSTLARPAKWRCSRDGRTTGMWGS